VTKVSFQSLFKKLPRCPSWRHWIWTASGPNFQCANTCLWHDMSARSRNGWNLGFFAGRRRDSAAYQCHGRRRSDGETAALVQSQRQYSRQGTAVRSQLDMVHCCWISPIHELKDPIQSNPIWIFTTYTQSNP